MSKITVWGYNHAEIVARPLWTSCAIRRRRAEWPVVSGPEAKDDAGRTPLDLVHHPESAAAPHRYGAKLGPSCSRDGQTVRTDRTADHLA